MLLPEGELTKRAKRHKIDWPGLVFMAAADQEPFVDVEFVTLAQHAVDMITPDAIAWATEQNLNGDQDALIKRYLKDVGCAVGLHEFVSVQLGGLTTGIQVRVGLAVDKIDDEAVDYGLELLGQVSKFEPGMFKEFGKSYLVSPEDGL